MRGTGRTVGRLVFEALAVLAGILAAFGIDAAWETARDRERAEDYLSALRSEMAVNLEIARNEIAEIDRDLLLIQPLYEALFDPGAEPPGAPQVVELVAYLGPRSTDFERAALTDLVSSGGTQYVDDPEIRRGVSAYDRQLATTFSDHEAFMAFWSGSIVPYFVEHGDLPTTFQRFLNFPGGWQFPETTLSMDVEAFAQDRTFQNLTANYLYWMLQLRRENVELEEVIVRVDSLIADGG